MWLKTDSTFEYIFIMYSYLTSFATLLSHILLRITTATLNISLFINIGLFILNVAWTYAVWQYLIVKRGKLFRAQFARRREVASDNEEVQAIRWQRTYKKLRNHQNLRNKQEAISEFLVQARVLGGRTHKIKPKRRWFFSR